MSGRPMWGRRVRRGFFQRRSSTDAAPPGPAPHGSPPRTGGAAPIPRWKWVVLHVWVLSWAVGLLFLFLQAALMADVWWMAVLTPVAPVAAYLGLRALVRAHAAGRSTARVAVAVIALAHLTPVVRQLLGAIEPTVDTTILGLVSMALLATFRDR